MKRLLVVVVCALSFSLSCAHVGPPVKKAAEVVVQCGGQAIEKAVADVYKDIVIAMSTGSWWTALQDILLRIGSGTFYCALDKYEHDEAQRPVMAALATGDPTNSDKARAFMDAHHVRISR